MNDAIGALKARLTLQSPARAPDSMGGFSVTWADQGEVWAEIAVAAVDEAAAFDALRRTAAYRLTINRREDVRAGWRAVWGGRVLRITGVRDEGAPRIVLICQEENL